LGVITLGLDVDVAVGAGPCGQVECAFAHLHRQAIPEISRSAVSVTENLSPLGDIDGEGPPRVNLLELGNGDVFGDEVPEPVMPSNPQPVRKIASSAPRTLMSAAFPVGIRVDAKVPRNCITPKVSQVSHLSH